MKRRRSAHLTLACLVAGVTSASVADVSAADSESKFIEKGVVAKVGGYRPVRAKLDESADIVKVAPEGLLNPKYGYFTFGDFEYAVVLDEPVVEEKEDATDEDKADDAKAEGQDKKAEESKDEDAEVEPRIFIDSNRDGDLTNDPKVEWRGTKRGPYTMYSGSGTVELGEGQDGSVRFYRFDPKDERRASLKDTVLYYADFGFEYTFKLDDEEHSTFIAGYPSGSEVLRVDRDQNGRISRRFEVAQPEEPFNFTGTTYVFEWKSGMLNLEKAAEEIDQMPMPPDLRLGKQALQFTATTMDGDKVEFPKDYAGKIVMLDLWATWCGPCIGEIPHMKEAYEEHHADGFEILGVSLDSDGMEEKVGDFLKDKEIDWPQIYEGKGWEASVSVQHDVSGIPFVLLVDGDSGKIIGTARQLRGPKLTKFIGEQLVAKGLKEAEEELAKDADSKDGGSKN